MGFTFWPPRIPCASCFTPTDDQVAVVIDLEGDEGDTTVCPACALALGLPACSECGAFWLHGGECLDCMPVGSVHWF
jgi:hypothetical protein